MKDLSPDARTEYIGKLIKNYNPELADAVINCYLEKLNDQEANSVFGKYGIKRQFKVKKSSTVFQSQINEKKR